ncbi:MAG: hydrogenase nickel incorporation protein HypB [candidate division WOR-3 bacterium]|nr:hydrogenase nickel incorporation protein HypB [candidate division WOR-3 bacterium]
MTEIKVLQKVLASNDALAQSHRKIFDQNNVTAINIMSAPGSGKTSLLEKTIEKIKNNKKIFVIEGDIKGNLDAMRLLKKGADCIQINTQGQCHLDGFMLSQALPKIDLSKVELLFIENVGNLVCPAEFDLGTHYNVMMLSTPEGSDKPVKYPLMFSKADLLLVNKIDLLPYVQFDFDNLEKSLKKLKPKLKLIKISCKTGEGIEEWVDWVLGEIGKRRNRR